MAGHREPEQHIQPVLGAIAGGSWRERTPAMAALELVSAPVVLCAPSGLVLYANGAFRGRFEDTRTPVVGGHLRTLLKPEVAESVLGSEAAASPQVVETSVDLRDVRAGRPAPMRLRAGWHEGEGQRVLCLVFEEQGGRARGSLAALVDLGARLVGQVAHDLNNELSVLLNCSSLISRRVSTNDALRALLDEMQETAWRASGMSQGLLHFGRAAERRDARMRLSAVVDGLLPLLQVLSAGRRSISVEVDDFGLSCLLPRARVELLLLRCVLSDSDVVGGEPRGGDPSPLVIRVYAEPAADRGQAVVLSVGPVPARALLQDSEMAPGCSGSVVLDKIQEAMARCGALFSMEQTADGMATAILRFPAL